MRRVLAVLALSAVLAGCSSGDGQTNGTGFPPAAANAPADPIPPVRDPKALAGTPPCQLLTAAQLAAYRINQSPRSKDVAGAPGCVWTDTAHTREIAVFVDIGPDVLRNIYAQRATYPVFDVTQVAAHPAIQTKNNVADTSCFFRVAAAEKQTFTLRFTSLRQGLEEPCRPARALAEDVLANLPPLKG